MAFDQQKYKDDYNLEHYDRVTIRLPKGQKDELKALATKKGLSVNGYVAYLIERAQKRNAKP